MDPLSDLVSSITAWGWLGLFGIALLERLVPILPSYGLLVAIGIASAGGAWSLAAALIWSTAGGLAGCLSSYGMGVALGERRSNAALRWSSRLAGLSTATTERLAGAFRRHQRTLAFGSQLVPTVRLVAPAVAGVLRADVRSFTIASACGIALWNGAFIAAGYWAARAFHMTNVSTLALIILSVLLLGEGMAAVLWHRARNHRRTRLDDEVFTTKE
jgi:membrane protein DedA with SNARE-associated domain